MYHFLSPLIFGLLHFNQAFICNPYHIFTVTLYLSSFIFTFVVCLYFYLKTKKTLKKLEKNFIKETETLSKIELENLKKQKVVREILVSHSKN